ncbi:hypothetical protein SEA_SBLACKBERRY_50 [Microbacterium phage SBlackberry]|uniref:Uncharacterized protein n=2 Tax=Goodmanvirus goodman TaxID=2734238 RepID=A0A3G3M097_9CAUD|nr:hypothetical protein HOU56_gp53 [Microbacterium phage Goodman]AYQ99676.1 hypothetical protein PBI_JOHANN_53 [Microbacterium phage Johann]QJD50029.1 hypothetical protein SEA_RASOVI_55 [Microbacterium phage Rasovi]UAW08795.1 hypothetical protein SEA_SBLACKBERRY_50 [Microbacterium phage SBlackberry]URM86960.1 hypothetical protein SEA_TYPHER_52 [Microbacterium phage Typher]AYQ99508.1 hypothetical protein PBI_GOODMAN_53 [Microbacterium phage Goodman]
MPDTLLPTHPVMRELYQMRPEGWEDRKALGGALVSLCLFHGTHRAFVGYQEVVVALGGRVWPGVKVPVVQVGCDPTCGYRVVWGREDQLGGCRCALDS